MAIVETWPEAILNLPFVLAYSLLDEVLSQYGKENQCGFKDKEHLGSKMEKLKTVLSWIDYQSIDEGKEHRNNLAHRAVLLSKNDCFRFIRAVENQFVSWGLISAP